MSVPRARVHAFLASFVFFVVQSAGAAKVTTTMTAAGAFGTLPAISFDGSEALSSLFHFDVMVNSDRAHPVAFDSTLGTEVSVSLTRGSSTRRFSGICSRISESVSSDGFTYGLELVPKLALLTHTQDSRIFQEKNVPDILSTVLQSHGIDFQVNFTHTYEARNYVVQYRESDFNFISRLMEEEGIYYSFTAADQMVLADSSTQGAGGSTANFLPAAQKDGEGVIAWQKSQQLTAGKVTLFDFNFELPHNNLDASKTVAGSSSGLEVYDYPGGYAERFDGVGPGGGDQPGDLQKIFPEATRAASLRAEEIAAASVVIDGNGNLLQFTAGSTFTLAQHPNGNGPYLLTNVHHSASLQRGSKHDYQNSFTCIPSATTFRPSRVTPHPVIGAQTAYVVGPAGEEIFVDKFARVKVQFHWDRQGKNDQNSSCWIRVDKLHHPDIGDEVIVAFQEGDPDQPIIVGDAFNPERMPPH